MKSIRWQGGLALGLAFSLASMAMAQVQVGVSVNSGGDSFNLAIGNYYHEPEQQVEVIQQRHIPEDETPVVFFIAARAHVTPQVIIDLRTGGMGWGAIAERYHLGPKVFYVAARGNFAGTPYEGFYHNYRHRGYRMSDADIVNMVNLRFASDYYHKPAVDIIRMRAKGQDFREIHQHYHPYKTEAHSSMAPSRREANPARHDRRDDHHQDDHNDHTDWN